MPEGHVRLGWVELYHAQACRGLGEFPEAKTTLGRVQISYEREFGADHLQMTGVLRPLGLIALAEGDLTVAESNLEKALAIFEKQKSVFRCLLIEDLADVQLKRASIEADKGNLGLATAAKAKALEGLLNALEIAQAGYPNDSPIFARLKARITDLQVK
jgi:hypothetical protein